MLCERVATRMLLSEKTASVPSWKRQNMAGLELVYISLVFSRAISDGASDPLSELGGRKKCWGGVGSGGGEWVDQPQVSEFCLIPEAADKFC